MGTLGNYIHLQWDGYLKGNTQRGTCFQEQKEVYDQIKKAETDVLNNYNKAVTDKQIQEFQNDLNIFFGIEEANENDKNSIFNNAKIREYINNEVMKHLKDSGIFKNKDISKIFLDTKTYDIKRNFKLTEKEEEILQNLKDIQKIYKEIDSSQKNREIKKFTGNIEKLETLLSQLNELLGIAQDEINQKEANPPIIGQVINDTLRAELSKFSLGIANIVNNTIKGKEKKISYEDVKKYFSNIDCGDNKKFSLYPAINNFIEMMTYTATINQMKGVALELLIGEMNIVKRAAKIAKNTAIEEIKKQIEKKSNDILNFEKTQAGYDRSKTIIIRSFYDDKYRERVNELSQTKTISVEGAGDIVITNAGGAQEKVDAYIYLNDDGSTNPLGVTAKNYKFTSSKKGGITSKTTIDLVKGSPLINFLQQGLNEASLDVFGNHLLNLNLNHYKLVNEKITYSSVPSSNVQSVKKIRQNYLSLLDEIIFIKSLTGESIMRLSEENKIYTINNASVLVINDNTSKMIKVHKLQDIIQSCFNTNNSSVKSYIKFSKNLSEIENRMVEGEKEETTRIAKILLDMESIKINAQVSLSYQQ